MTPKQISSDLVDLSIIMPAYNEVNISDFLI